MFVGAILFVIGGQIHPWYYRAYYPILKFYFKLEPSEVFKKIQKLTQEWKNKKINVKLAISNRNITKMQVIQVFG